MEGIILTIPALLIAITIHEYAHGYVAYRLGDPTAKNYGRLTFNPLKHLDPLGALMLLIFRFGWAKPVPVNPAYFKDPKKGMALVGLAGPASNVFVAFITLLIAKILDIQIFAPVIFGFTNQYLTTTLLTIVLLNIGLAIFNLLPVPPLDGSKIFNSVLPPKIYFGIMRYESYAHIILLLLLFTGILTPVLVWLQEIVLRALIILVNMLPL